MAKMDVAKQRQKAQVVLRNPSLSKVKCVKPVKPRGGSLHSNVKPSSNLSANSARLQTKSFLETNGGRLKLVTPRLPWNAGKVQSKIDSGLYNNRTAQRASLVVVKDPCPKPRKPNNYLAPAVRDKPLNNSTSNIPNYVGTANVVMRRPKPKSANSEVIAVKRRSRSMESFMESSSGLDTYLSPTQCFKCRKDLSNVLDSSASDRFSDAYSSASDLNCSLPELQGDENNNVVYQVTNKKLSVSRTEVLKAEKLVQHPPPVDIVSDTECYQYQFESDSQAESDYSAAVASDSEVYRYKSKIKDKRNLHLDSPSPHLMREHRAESAGSIRERKIQLEQDLDSLLDSMAFALENYGSKAKSSDADKIGGSEDSLYTPPAFFRPIFEVKI